MLNIIITAYGEPKSTARAVRAFLEQDIKQKYRIFVVDPFPEVEEFILNEFIDHPQVEFFSDPGKGKSYALNLLLKNIYTGKKNDIVISTDGDVWVSKNSVKDIIDCFKDDKVGIVCGHPVSVDDKKKMYGYWSHLLLHDMNKTRKKLDKKGFFATSGYLFAFRNIVSKFPTEASEDNVLPIIFWRKGYRIKYCEDAEVYVKNPTTFKDWVIQKKRNLKGHEALKRLFSKNVPKRENTFFGEAFRGLVVAFSYPRNLKEFFWTWLLMFSRLYIWFIAFCEIYFKKEKYHDGWRVNETESTRGLD